MCCSILIIKKYPKFYGVLLCYYVNKMICLYKFLILYNINFYFDVCMDFVIFKNEISDIKTSERPKNIEESYDSQLINY